MLSNEHKINNYDLLEKELDDSLEQCNYLSDMIEDMQVTINSLKLQLKHQVKREH